MLRVLRGHAEAHSAESLKPRVTPGCCRRVKTATAVICVFVFLSIAIDGIDALPSTTPAHLKLMRKRPITAPIAFQVFIKGPVRVCGPKRRVEGVLDLGFV